MRDDTSPVTIIAVTIVATFTTAATFAAMVWAWRNPWSVAFPKAGRP